MNDLCFRGKKELERRFLDACNTDMVCDAAAAAERLVREYRLPAASMERAIEERFRSPRLAAVALEEFQRKLAEK